MGRNFFSSPGWFFRKFGNGQSLWQKLLEVEWLPGWLRNAIGERVGTEEFKLLKGILTVEETFKQVSTKRLTELIGIDLTAIQIAVTLPTKFKLLRLPGVGWILPGFAQLVQCFFEFFASLRVIGK